MACLAYLIPLLPLFRFVSSESHTVRYKVVPLLPHPCRLSPPRALTYQPFVTLSPLIVILQYCNLAYSGTFLIVSRFFPPHSSRPVLNSRGNTACSIETNYTMQY
jgi:hypothetical protein